MDASDLFDLYQFGNGYQGLMFDKDLFLWRKERRGNIFVFRRMACQTDWPATVNSDFLKLSDFRDAVSKMPAFIEFKKEREEKSKTLKGKYIVCSIEEDAVPTSSIYPNVFKDMDSVKNALQKLHPSLGSRFAVFQCVSIAQVDGIVWE